MPGYAKNSEGTACVACTAGHARAFDDDSCSPCGDGYVAVEEGSAYCELCGIGNYSSADHTECLVCPRNTFSLGGVASCTECTAGSSKRGSSYCEDCKAGTFLNRGKVPPTCDECAAGSVSPAGASACTQCEAGTWQKGIECVACSAGRHGNATGLHSFNCSGTCPPGTHSYRYATKCSECDAGKHAPSPDAEDCKTCDASHPTYLTSLPGAVACICLPGKFKSTGGACLPCSEGMDCVAAGSDVSALQLKRGHWRPSDASDEVLPCPIPAACAPGNATDERGCVPGNEGVMCALCSKDFYRPSPFVPCEACGGRGASIASALAILLVMLVGLGLFVYVNRKAPSGLLRPFINLVQTLTVMLMFDAPFPEALVKMGKALSGLSLGVEVASPQCAGLPSGYYANFTSTVLTLLLVCAGMMAVPLWAKRRNGWTWGELALSPKGALGFRDLFVVVLLLHPTVSGKAMEFFRCQRIDGVSYLMADFAVVCHDSTWWAFLPFVTLVLGGFALGTPAAIFYALRGRRATLYEADGTVKPQPLDILFGIYQPHAYYYEDVQMASLCGL